MSPNRPLRSDSRHQLKQQCLLPSARDTRNEIRSQAVSRSPRQGGSKPGVKATFPSKLHKMIDHADVGNYQHIISWCPHGRAFFIPDKTAFAKTIMPTVFHSMSQYASFQRQLNLYGFLRITRAGPDKEAYYHPLFLRGRPELVTRMERQRINGKGTRQLPIPDDEPDFYSMDPMGPPMIIGRPDETSNSSLENVSEGTSSRIRRQPSRSAVAKRLRIVRNETFPLNFHNDGGDAVAGVSREIFDRQVLVLPGPRTSVHSEDGCRIPGSTFPVSSNSPNLNQYRRDEYVGDAPIPFPPHAAKWRQDASSIPASLLNSATTSTFTGNSIVTGATNAYPKSVAGPTGVINSTADWFAPMPPSIATVGVNHPSFATTQEHNSAQDTLVDDVIHRVFGSEVKTEEDTPTKRASGSSWHSSIKFLEDIDLDDSPPGDQGNLR